MPTIGGANIAWDEGKPAGADSLGIGDDQIRSDKTAIRTALAAEHIWESTGGANTGAHVLGSARPFYGTQSAVSSSGSDGRFMATSDTSRLFGVGSGGTVFYGGATVISAGSFPGTVPQRYYWAMEFGQATADVNGAATITIPNSGYSGVPFIHATALSGAAIFAVPGLSPTATTFGVIVYDTAGATVGGAVFNWQSIGTRVF